MPSVDIRQGDALKMMQTLPEASVHCCVTSPPYWGLRDYGTAKWEGGAADCDHSYNHGVQGTTGQRADRTFTAQAVYKDECRRCGAVRVDGQLGLERTPEEYVARMVEVFREVRRVLRDDGTLWLNIGDSYSNDTKWGGTSGGKNATSAAGGYQGQRVRRGTDCDPKRGKRAEGQPIGRCNGSGLKPKDLVGIPWMLAFALRGDGWYLRSEIIWHKPNPMPESVKDRPTKSHEQIFLLAKRECYYYEDEAIREPHSEVSIARAKRNRFGGKYAESDPIQHGALKSGNGYGAGADHAKVLNPAGANRRTVWTVPTHPFPEAHFATFPEKLIEPSIKAGCPAGGTVLDPFAGSGTTGLVARRLGRNFLGIELNPEYVAMASRRMSQDVMEFTA